MARPRRVKQRSPGGFISKNRIAWTNIVLGTFSLLRQPETDEKPNIEGYEFEPGDEIVLQVPNGPTYFTEFRLTKLTSLELDYLEAIFARAIATARPIVERRDKYVSESELDTFERQYRAVPQFFVRSGNE